MNRGRNDFSSLLFPGRLVEKIEIREISPCMADPERIKFIAQADRPLDDVLSILYLYMPNSNYSESLAMVSYKQSQRLITVFANGKISMTYVKDRQEAERLVEELRGILNRAIVHYISKGRPDPKLIEAKKRVNVKTVYELLPRSDCKECGEAGCYAYAIKLVNGDADLEKCRPLFSISNLDRLNRLKGIMQPIR
ncbi:MAG: (Fe-S)-binding protein, partial [Candidatus Bathyarchaeia archaeon]